MDILEQPLEAVAFRVHSLPEAAAAWTWLAAVLAAAAAAGVWRLRSSTAPSAVITDDVSKPLNPDTSPLLVPAAAEAERWVGRLSCEPTTSTSSVPALSPRERYTAYYQDAGCVGCCDVESDEEEGTEDRDPEDDGGVYVPSEAGRFEWEVVRPLLPPMAATAAETGRFQNPRALSGSVVRLWDQGGDRSFIAAAAASRRRSGRAGTVSSF
ncbi:uncharacterized protein LOC123411197 [Hordeum vulgare subsp. vulgare]|uniref:uncharacterized protein LOC123411197 n=1 Tax=Hordeum vulgare subsp. vulgare TaxID=112509 RepID=UPI000B462E56|nr:uncharacterized protein LOC123411197 [Hordeum vulgare subsp. vulgare]